MQKGSELQLRHHIAAETGLQPLRNWFNKERAG
jgi:hypothetical protein